jgi:DNA-directed RNA polymerase subunit F
MISEAATEGSQRVSLKSTVSFDDAIETMHETIGCVSVERKPTLAYKCSTANKNATSINLCTGDDWDGLVDDVLAKTKTKKDISVNIIVLPEIREFVIATCSNLGGLRGMWSGVFK